ncbi:MAG: hypothetical protein WED05_06910 [Candidatus Atabeyarchaeum deiterrae]
MIRNVWVIEKLSGRCLFHLAYEKELKEPDLISGFLSALTSFSEAELKGERLSVVETEGRKWVYRYVEPLIFVVTGAKKDPESHLKAQVSYLANVFLDAFPELKAETARGFFEKWSGDRNYFGRLEPLVDQLVGQWSEVDQVNKAAKALDVVEIYQRIFDAIISDVKACNGKISTEFQSAVKEFDDACKAKITYAVSEFSPTLDLLNINVFSTGYEKLKEELGLLLTRLMRILKDHLPAGETERIMKSKIVPIMKTDWKRIDVYNIDPVLISLL